MDLDTETYPVDITNIDCDRDIRTYQGNQEIEIPMITLFKEGPKTDVRLCNERQSNIFVFNCKNGWKHLFDTN